MSGRRGQIRLAFANSGGVLRISRDVVVMHAAQNEFVAASSQPGIPGDVLTIAFSGRDGQQSETVRVAASKPVVVDGVVKHELRLERLASHSAIGDKDCEQVESENQ
jgi:hypothetical protein